MLRDAFRRSIGHSGLNRILTRPDGPLKEELADVSGLRLAPAR